MKTTPVPFLFIGTGPIGVAAMHRLSRQVRTHNMAVIDPNEPFAEFRRAADAIGMRDMRSPWQVHVVGDADYGDLEFFACRGIPVRTATPPVHIAHEHTLAVWRNLGIAHHKQKARSANFDQGTWTVTLEDDTEVVAKHLVCNFGHGIHRREPLPHSVPLPEQPIPDTLAGHVAIIGGGMTACHAALTALERGAETVTLFAPGGLKVQKFETSPDWTVGNCTGGCLSHCAGNEEAIAAFRGHKMGERLEIVRAGHQNGTINQALFDAVTGYSHITVEEARVQDVTSDSEAFALQLSDGRSANNFRHVFDARGYAPHVQDIDRVLPGIVSQLRDPLEGLTVGDKKTTMVGPNLWIGGPLDALNRGPASGTIAGGTALGRDIARAIRTGHVTY